MMADGVFQASEATIVEKGWLQSGVTQGRGAKLIPILGQPSHLFQAKVFVGSGTIEGNIANNRRDLRHADHVLFEIGEHLIGLARHGMTLDTTRLAEEEQRTSLLIQGEGIFMAACELINRGVGEYQRKLEFSDGLAKHVEGDNRPLVQLQEIRGQRVRGKPAWSSNASKPRREWRSYHLENQIQPPRYVLLEE